MTTTSPGRAAAAACAVVTALVVTAASASAVSTSTSTTTSSKTTASTPNGYLTFYDFEDGTTQGWKPLGGTRLSVVTDPTTGSHRLLVSGVTAPGQGAVVDVNPALLTVGKSYTGRGSGWLTPADTTGQFQLHEFSTVPDRPWTDTWFGDGHGYGWLETDFTWTSAAPSLQLGVVASAACPGFALPSAFEVDNLLLSEGGFSARPVYVCPPATTTTKPTTVTTSVTTQPTTVTTSATTTAGCSASYRVVSTWSGGFQASVTVSAGSSALSGWTVSWTLPSGNMVTQVWNATVITTGATAVATNAGYNGSVVPGASTSFGFLASSSSGTPVVPALVCRSR